MRLLSYNDIPITKRSLAYANDFFERVSPVLIDCYKVDEMDIPSMRSAVKRQLIALYEAVDGDLEKQVVLDLGCGVVGGYENENCSRNKREFEPWLLRMLNHGNIRTIGVDNQSQKSELFETYTADLSLENSLLFLADLGITIANSSGVIKSSTFNECGTAPEKLFYAMCGSLEQVLPTEGLFVIDRPNYLNLQPRPYFTQTF